MSKSLPPSVRRQIIASDPSAPDAVSVSAFCRTLGISRPSFYKVRDRFQQEGNAALNPRSRAPKQPAQVYTDDARDIVLTVQTRLKASGWDAGPKSIWHLCVDEALFVDAVPSVSTIARILLTAGVVDKNPRKRPRSSYIRFQRGAAMEMWQLDAFEYRLFDAEMKEARTKVTVYQLLDDSTRFDVGTRAFAAHENGDDAVTAVTAALDEYGAPQELLSANGSAFNLIRRGGITGLQRVLAAQGCLGITGNYASPTTQGKNERSHLTVQRFLNAHTPTTLVQVQALLVEYREYYNDRRHHQSLPGEMTPGQAWAAAEHRPSDRTAITDAELDTLALAYKDRAMADAMLSPRAVATVAPDGTAALGASNPSLTKAVINRQNPQVYWHGKMIRVPTYLVGTYVLVIADGRYTLFDTVTGIETISFPLPWTRTSPTPA